MIPRVKICCISSIEEAELAIEMGADAVGLVGPMPSGPGIISDKTAREIAASVAGRVETFLLSSETTSEDIVAHHKLVDSSTIQIVDDLKEGTHEDIRSALPGIQIVQVVHVVSGASVEKAIDVSVSADFVLLDSGNPDLEVKELGGTGRTHNWDISREIVRRSGKPVFLAGGLEPENIAAAIRAVDPYGIDLCSGVRTNGVLDRGKLERFMVAVYSS